MLNQAEAALHQAIHRIKAAPLADLKQEQFVADIIRSAGIVDDERKDHYGEDRKYMIPRGSVYQKPGELAQVMIRLSELSIKSYVELGVFRGGTFGLMLAYLGRFNGSVHGLAVDRENRLFFESLEGLDFQFIKTDTCHLELVRGFDLAMVDAWHDYQTTKDDFFRVQHGVRFCLFHDIVDDFCRGGSTRFWDEIKLSYPHEEFVVEPMNSMGIGLLWLV